MLRIFRDTGSGLSMMKVTHSIFLPKKMGDEGKLASSSISMQILNSIGTLGSKINFVRDNVHSEYKLPIFMKRCFMRHMRDSAPVSC